MSQIGATAIPTMGAATVPLMETSGGYIHSNLMANMPHTVGDHPIPPGNIPQDATPTILDNDQGNTYDYSIGNLEDQWKE